MCTDISCLCILCAYSIIFKYGCRNCMKQLHKLVTKINSVVCPSIPYIGSVLNVFNSPYAKEVRYCLGACKDKLKFWIRYLQQEYIIIIIIIMYSCYKNEPVLLKYWLSAEEITGCVALRHLPIWPFGLGFFSIVMLVPTWCKN